MGFKSANISSIKLPNDAESLKQTYDKVQLPDGVVVIKLNVFPDDQGGWFKEVLRADENGFVQAVKDAGYEFKIKQSNISYLGAHAKRFWHIHPNQNEIWTTNNTLLLGLVDLRKDSATYGVKSKIVISSEKAVYIPSGVAHGLLNPNNYPVTLIYYTDKHFEATEDTEEYRIDPKELPFDFVEPEIM